MPALSKFWCCWQSFFWARHANAFTCLSPIARNQVWGNHFIQFEKPMSNPTNKLSCEPIHKPTKPMDLDAKLPSNLSSKKTQVADSKPKQDAELLCQILSTQPCGLCHDSKSEQVASCQDQNASQDDHPQPSLWQIPESVNLDKSGHAHHTWRHYIRMRLLQLILQQVSQSYVTCHFRVRQLDLAQHDKVR